MDPAIIARVLEVEPPRERQEQGIEYEATKRAVARELGLSAPSITNIERRVLEKCYRRLAVAGITRDDVF